ncbi:cysteine hydrolase family protein [Rhodocytophaga aerolata]|uniref:Cysteine hydrolase family protein n=1 Tax=Rhodocytophaga aerolata TaxID=455078 RepID=A0ABT8RFB3_9BACT|nr:cysteine hydrolase family protein [Rhodocytophaga aerolata]MDO1450794.1 cysteine hydrolase family protein [Rhodocytophaga aerolata]
MRVLLVIDMQKESFPATLQRFDSSGVIQRINRLAASFRAKGDKIIYIQHDGTRENCYIPFTEGWELLSQLDVQSSDLIMAKTANDAFYQTNLKGLLQALSLEEVVITGCASDFCVDATVKSALSNDFPVTVISNGHTTADRPGLTAKQVVDHYNWIWQELSPTKSKIKVLDLDTYLQNN